MKITIDISIEEIIALRPVEKELSGLDFELYNPSILGYKLVEIYKGFPIYFDVYYRTWLGKEFDSGTSLENNIEETRLAIDYKVAQLNHKEK